MPNVISLPADGAIGVGARTTSYVVLGAVAPAIVPRSAPPPAGRLFQVRVDSSQSLLATRTSWVSTDGARSVASVCTFRTALVSFCPSGAGGRLKRR